MMMAREYSNFGGKSGWFGENCASQSLHLQVATLIRATRFSSGVPKSGTVRIRLERIMRLVEWQHGQVPSKYSSKEISTYVIRTSEGKFIDEKRERKMIKVCIP